MYRRGYKSDELPESPDVAMHTLLLVASKTRKRATVGWLIDREEVRLLAGFRHAATKGVVNFPRPTRSDAEFLTSHNLTTLASVGVVLITGSGASAVVSLVRGAERRWYFAVYAARVFHKARPTVAVETIAQIVAGKKWKSKIRSVWRWVGGETLPPVSAVARLMADWAILFPNPPGAPVTVQGLVAELLSLVPPESVPAESFLAHWKAGDEPVTRVAGAMFLECARLYVRNAAGLAAAGLTDAEMQRAMQWYERCVALYVETLLEVQQIESRALARKARKVGSR